MILYPVLSKQDRKQDTNPKSVILSNIRIPWNVIANMKARKESPVRKAIVIKFFNNLILQSVVACCKAIKFVKVKTRFSLEHVISGLLN